MATGHSENSKTLFIHSYQVVPGAIKAPRNNELGRLKLKPWRLLLQTTNLSCSKATNHRGGMLEAEVTSSIILYVHSTEPWLNKKPGAKTTFLSSSRWMPGDLPWHFEHLFRQSEAQQLIISL